IVGADRSSAGRLTTRSQAPLGNARLEAPLRCLTPTPTMTRSRYRIFEDEYPYFMTWTIVGWVALFTRREAVNIVLDSWRFLQRNRAFKLFGYIILENH